MTPNELRRWGRALRRELTPLIQQHPNDFRLPSFNGACGVTAYAMKKLLERLGHQPLVAIAGGAWPGTHHCWTELDGYIIDLTATQFGYAEPVQVVVRPSEWHKPRLCDGDEALDRLRRWIGGQNPFRHRVAIDDTVTRALTPR